MNLKLFSSTSLFVNRDIAGNWNIDIARDLEDYLEDLSKIQVSFGGKGKNGSTTCNFAEAALLIQGSACVYSRKVESLYELVVLAINAITSSKNKKKKRKIVTMKLSWLMMLELFDVGLARGGFEYRFGGRKERNRIEQDRDERYALSALDSSNCNAS